MKLSNHRIEHGRESHKAAPLPPPNTPHSLAQQTRKRFVAMLDGCIADLANEVQMHFSKLLVGDAQAAATAKQPLSAETARLFQSRQQNWTSAARTAWRSALTQPPHLSSFGVANSGLGDVTLKDDAVIDIRILASSLVDSVRKAAEPGISHLQHRIQRLERTADGSSQDVLHPETLVSHLIEAWFDCGLTRPMWELALPAIRPMLTARMAEAYRATNDYLSQNGVAAAIDPRPQFQSDLPNDYDIASPANADVYGNTPPGSRPTAWLDTQPGHAPAAQAADPSTLAPTHEQTRPTTGLTPVARIRERAQNVLGQLRRLMGDRFDAKEAHSILSAQLERALAEQPMPFAETALEERESAQVSSGQVQGLATELRQHTDGLKTQTEKPSERTIIEIVALMFQSILGEDRIAPSIRVWFARLQMPVLRLALAEPDFFASVTHPARQLIDCMGSCALGFDATQISTCRLESEVKRIVQVIEQYPETGRRVYQLVLKEFKKFIGRSLTETEAVQQVATLAQQIEQKEALSVQYTIELHRMLASVPVGDTVREFLFRVWADVLAMAAVRHGPQHAETLRFKQAAADLLRSVSPRSDAAEHERLVQQFAHVIIVLREGMTTLAIPGNKQSDYVKRLTGVVEQAFAPENNSISQATLDDLAHQLAKLEDVVNDDSEGEVLLAPHMIDLMFGSEGNALEVISTGGLPPTEDMLQWTHEQELGAWFSLDHKGMVSLAQYVWHSARGQLHLLNSSDGKSYLMQTHQFAAYLQAGLLTPVEDETLTARATRQALAQISTESAPLQ
jgi:hypothetical protein